MENKNSIRFESLNIDGKKPDFLNNDKKDIHEIINHDKKLFCDKIKDIKKFINRKSDNNV